ncbi:class I SAM-dependent methyltransferase [Roseivivax sediminis]|uniref:Methyltransferase domain-containing protein n=1 Tax=Roseivivax sediminis TaxID=936889 RepID=A0A1I2DSD9_9RHOB|nr:methyltransferase domain-containing protein [Roseivivax sediminis]SFE83299.1 Methyltransferase domain-containing protein [Roseivivax sediminis]
MQSVKAAKTKRREAFLNRFDLASCKGLEIGPFDRPVFNRDRFPGILYADVQDTETLRNMAARAAEKGKPRDPADVVPVDHVLLDRQLDEVIPHRSLDFVFCAHVLEHVPDMIRVLQGVERILRPGGVFLMAYPDRRYTYDIDRPATTLAQLRDRHTRGLTRPDPDIVREHFLMNRPVNVRALWEGKSRAIGSRRHTPEFAEARAKAARDAYVDVHCNVLSSAEFGPLMQALRAEGLIGLDLALVEETRAPQHEFYAALVRPMPQIERIARGLLRRAGRPGIRSNPRIR